MAQATPLIYDVGAHKGEDTDFYLKKGFRVVAVEAAPLQAKALRERFSKAVASGQLTVVEAAVADAEGEIEFFANVGVSEWGTINKEWAERNVKLGTKSSTVMVQAVKFENILKRHGVPHYLKVDIEGADMLCVKALKHFDAKPKFVSVESNKTSWRGLIAEFDTLEELGYTRFKVVNQARVESQVEPSPPREGNYSGHRFAFGCTGLFGEELPGEWLTRARALRKYAAIFLHYKFLGDNTLGNKMARHLPWRLRRVIVAGWYDTHAAR